MWRGSSDLQALDDAAVHQVFLDDFFDDFKIPFKMRLSTTSPRTADEYWNMMFDASLNHNA